MGRKMTDEKLEVINELLESARKVVAALEVMKVSGNTSNKILEDLGLKPRVFRHMVYDTFWLDGLYDETRMAEWRRKHGKGAIPTLTWQEELFCDAMGISQEDALYCFPDDVNETIEDLVATLLPREQEIVHYIWEEGMTFEEIGEIYSLTKERIRQIYLKILRKMTWRGHKTYMVNGRGEWLSRKKVYDAAYDDILIKAKVEQLRLLDEKVAERRGEVGDFVKLASLDLSVRAYNCLKRRGIETVGDIKALETVEELLKTKNLGRKACDEICRVMWDRFNFKFKNSEGEYYEAFVRGDSVAV